MMRPCRRRIIPRSTARDSLNAAVRLTAITRFQSSSVRRTKRVSRVRPGVVDQDVEITHRGLGGRHQRLDRGAVREIAREDVDAFPELRGERVERLAPSAGDARPWRPADAGRARCRRRSQPLAPVTKRLPAAQVEHGMPRPSIHADFRHCHVDVLGRADGQRLGAVDDAFGEPGQDLARSHLYEGVDPRSGEEHDRSHANGPCR